MIVIAIIGILAAALFPSLTAYLKRSRDAGRSANLNTISTAVGGYYSDTEKYPLGTSTGCVRSNTGFTDAANLLNYFPKAIPQDPLQTTAASTCGQINGGRTEYGFG